VTARPYGELFWDGAQLSLEPGAGRRLGIDRRCLEGDSVPDCLAHVCALTGEADRIPFDQPEVQAARRDALAWWIPLLGESLVCLSTFSVDSVHFAGAVTVARDPEGFDDDPFARLFPGTTVRTGLFCAVPPPAGPIMERTAGAPWPGGRFPAAVNGFGAARISPCGIRVDPAAAVGTDTELSRAAQTACVATPSSASDTDRSR
jgi:hypothetical protein